MHIITAVMRGLIKTSRDGRYTRDYIRDTEKKYLKKFCFDINRYFTVKNSQEIALGA